LDAPAAGQPAAGKSLQGREIAFIEDPLDALVLQIQGSGRLLVTEPDGSQRLVRLSFAGHNEQPYKSVGRWLIDQGELRAEAANWPAIKDWARRNPARLNEMLWSNPRVVFFREEPLPDPNVGPRGGQAVPLTPGRSIAVDTGSMPVRHAGLAGQHRAAQQHAAAPPGDGAGHRQRHQRRGARRLFLGLGQRGRAAGRTHEAAAAHVGAVAARAGRLRARGAGLRRRAARHPRLAGLLDIGNDKRAAGDK
jgi:hypothetical protein